MKLLHNLFQHEGARRYGKNVLWLALEKVLRLFLGLVIGAIVARYLGPRDFGSLMYIQSFLFLIFSISNMGLENVVARKVALRDKDAKEDELVFTSVVLRLLGGAVALAIIWVFLYHFENSSDLRGLIILVSCSVFFQALNIIEFYFQAKALSKYISLSSLASLVIGAFLKIIFIALGKPLFYFALTILIESFVLSLCYLFFFISHKSRTRLSIGFSFSRAKLLMNESWPLLIMSVMLASHSRIDAIMIKGLIGEVEVGYYSVAVRIVESMGFVPVVVGSALFPALANSRASSPEFFSKRMINYYRLSFILFLVTSVPIFIFSGTIIGALFGSSYESSVILLKLMTLRLFFTIFGVARGSFITVEGLFRFSLLTAIVGAISNILLNYFLIPLYGPIGAIVATIISFFLSTFGVDIIYAPTRKNILFQLKGMFSFYKLQIETN